MSIFPKRVRKNENVIIHFKTHNIEKPKFIQYRIDIIDKDGNVVMEYENEEISNEVHETYYSFKPDNSMLGGKYHVRSKVFLEGRIIESFSSIMDYFYIDDIDVEIKRKDDGIAFELKNRSGSRTPFFLLNRDGIVVEKGELEPLENRNYSFDQKPVFLKYGNNYIEKIGDGINIFVKANTIRWRIINNSVEVLDETTYKLFQLNKLETSVWIMIDGINSVNDILSGLSIDNKENLDRILEKLENNRLIRKV